MQSRPEDFAQAFFSGNGASYDHIAAVSTLGLDAWWKRKIIAKIPPSPRAILEQASGTGILTVKLARLFPDCRIVGVELHEGYLDVARQKVRDLNLRNVELIHGPAEEVVANGPFDAIVSDYLAKYVDLDRLVGQARVMLREGGALVMHELTRPKNPAFLALWRMHFRFLRAYGRWKHPEWEIAFRDVPDLLAQSRWVDDLAHAMRANHFADIAIEPLMFEASTLVSARK